MIACSSDPTSTAAMSSSGSASSSPRQPVARVSVTSEAIRDIAAHSAIGGRPASRPICLTPDVRGRTYEMKRAAVLVLALGCGTGAVPAGPARTAGGQATAAEGAAAVSPLSYLGDEFERVFPGRVRLARYGAVRLAAGDAAPAIAVHGEGGEAIDLAQSPSLVVVDSRGERLRVVVQEGDYRLLLWIDERDLNWVIVDAVDVAFEPGEPAAAPPAPGVRLRPGLPVVRGDQRGSLVFVSHEDSCLSVAGWV